jgi:glycosyltransferase involved in cell wall biosynthesis
VDARAVDHPTARRRGIGRWVTGLLHGLVAIDAPAIALVGSDVEAEVLSSAVPGLTIRRWSPQVIRQHAEPGTWFVATQLMLHPIALDPIPRVVTEARLPVAAVMYDVIPYRFPEKYLDEPNALRQAQLRAPLARTVDRLLAISEFAATTSSIELNYPSEWIATVGSGVEPRFAPALDDPRPRSARVLPDDIGAYVVAVTGGDDRKNTDGLIRAWALVERSLPGREHLVIATGHTPEVLRRWELCATDAGIGDRVVFTGALDDDELVAVLQGASLSVMPSFEEGFGLPVLEAAACEVPTISSNLTSLPEVLDEPLSCFDPHDDRSIADAIIKALTDDDHRATLLAAGARAVERWSWPNVARATLTSLEESGPRWTQRIVEPRRRTAFAGAFTGSSSALGEYNESVVAAIGDRVEHLVFVDGSDTPEPTRADADRWPIRAIGRYVKPWDVDHIVAILGYSVQHVATAELARTVPCHLWIHDDALQGVVFGANLQALDIARSVIVASGEAAERLRRATEHSFPVLVLSVATSIDDVATALVEWLADVDDLDPTTIRYR